MGRIDLIKLLEIPLALFYKNEGGGAIIPTPMGIQQFLITTDLFQLELGRLHLSYRLLTLDGEQEFANYQLLVEWED